MLPKQADQVKEAPGGDSTFPSRCRRCGTGEVVLSCIPYDAEVRHDGRLYAFTIPNLRLPVCQSCGEKIFTEEVDSQVNDALRAHLKLLTPAQIREGIQRVQASQKEVAGRLGIAEATLSRWLNETQIQSRAMDNLLRTFFAFPDVRTALCGDNQDPHLGTADAAVGNNSMQADSYRAPPGRQQRVIMLDDDLDDGGGPAAGEKARSDAIRMIRELAARNRLNGLRIKDLISEGRK